MIFPKRYALIATLITLALPACRFGNTLPKIKTPEQPAAQSQSTPKELGSGANAILNRHLIVPQTAKRPTLSLRNKTELAEMALKKSFGHKKPKHYIPRNDRELTALEHAAKLKKQDELAEAKRRKVLAEKRQVERIAHEKAKKQELLQQQKLQAQQKKHQQQLAVEMERKQKLAAEMKRKELAQRKEDARLAALKAIPPMKSETENAKSFSNLNEESSKRGMLGRKETKAEPTPATKKQLIARFLWEFLIIGSILAIFFYALSRRMEKDSQKKESRPNPKLL